MNTSYVLITLDNDLGFLNILGMYYLKNRIVMLKISYFTSKTILNGSIKLHFTSMYMLYDILRLLLIILKLVEY